MTISISVSTGKQKEYIVKEHHLNVVKTAKYTCKYCGFKSVVNNNVNADTLEKQAYMYVHSQSYSLDENASDLECVCPLCYGTLNIGTVKKPTYIYYPEASQEQVNHLLMVMASVITMGLKDDYLADQAIKVYLKLEQYKLYVGQIFELLSKKPSSLPELLYWLAIEEPETYKNRNIALKDIRLLPINPTDCKDLDSHISYWNTYKWYQEDMKEEWLAIHSKHMKVIENTTIS